MDQYILTYGFEPVTFNLRVYDSPIITALSNSTTPMTKTWFEPVTSNLQVHSPTNDPTSPPYKWQTLYQGAELKDGSIVIMVKGE